MDCIFCKIIAGDIPAYEVYEDENVLAFLDINPVNPGHTLVVPKQHHATLVDLPTDLACKIMETIKKITPAILAGVGADSFNLGLNNGKTAGQVVDHVHFHIMPRFADDGHVLWKGRDYQEGQAQQVLEKIKQSLSDI